MKREDYKFFIYGLRKKLNLTQKELGNLIGSPRRTVGQYEDGSKVAGKSKTKKLLNLARSKGYKYINLIKHGKKYFYEVEKREQSKILELEYSKELAELIGILLGDGCIQKGYIIIAFNKKLDKDFIKRRVSTLIKKLLNLNIFIKTRKITNEGSLYLYSRPFIKFLENKCNLKPGSKIINKTTIPKWCFNNKDYISHVLRGLFDTDGYFESIGKSPRVEFRFSNKCQNLIIDTHNALNQLNIKSSLKEDIDGTTIRIHSRKEVTKFFKIIGSSNMKHISRFISWRINLKNYSIKEVDNVSYILDLPFIWDKGSNTFKKYIKEDKKFLKYTKMRKNYNWNLIASELIKIDKIDIAKTLKMHDRSIRSWRERKRIPSVEKIPLILKLIKKYNINLQEYKK